MLISIVQKNNNKEGAGQQPRKKQSWGSTLRKKITKY